MKKLIVLLAILFASTLYGEDELPKEDWEVAPGIISGGYSEETGAYVFKLFNIYTAPTLVFDRHYAPFYQNFFTAIINIGYGSFQKYGAGKLIESDRDGDVQKTADGTIGLKFEQCDGIWNNASPHGESISWVGDSTTHVYKRELIPPMTAVFNHENYNIKTGQDFYIHITPEGGSGFYTVVTGSKPAFLIQNDFGSWNGVCYVPSITSISVVVTDIVTGQTWDAFATILVDNDPEDPTFPDDDPSAPDDPSDPSDPSNPSDPSDPSDPSEPTDPSNPDSPTEPDEPDTPTEPDEPTEPAEPEEPNEPDVPAEPEDPADPDIPDSPVDPSDPNSPDTPDIPDNPSDPDEPVVVVPDPTVPEEPVVVPDSPEAPDDPGSPDTPNDPIIVVPDPVLPDEPVVVPDSPETPDEPEDSEPSDISNISDESDDVIIIDPTDPGNDDNEPTLIVVNSEDSDSDKIVVTDDGVTTVRKDNYDLAIFLGMFGAITGISGSSSAPANAPMEAQKAQQESSQNKINYVE